MSLAETCNVYKSSIKCILGTFFTSYKVWLTVRWKKIEQAHLESWSDIENTLLRLTEDKYWILVSFFWTKIEWNHQSLSTSNNAIFYLWINVHQVYGWHATFQNLLSMRVHRCSNDSKSEDLTLYSNKFV